MNNVQLNDILNARKQANSKYMQASMERFEAQERAKLARREFIEVKKNTEEQILNYALTESYNGVGHFIENTSMFKPSIDFWQRRNLNLVEQQWVNKAEALTKAMDDMLEAKDALLQFYTLNPTEPRKISVKVDIEKLSKMTGSYIESNCKVLAK